MPTDAPTITATSPSGSRVPAWPDPAGVYSGLICAAGTVGVWVPVVVSGVGAAELAERLRTIGYRDVSVEE